MPTRGPLLTPSPARTASLFAIPLVIAALTISAPTRVSAQDDAVPSGYDALIDEAVAEFGDGHWAEARALFERAAALYPNARALRGVGMAAFEMRDYRHAATALEQALAHTVRALTEEQITHARDLLERARGFLGHYRVPAAPEGSTLRVDGTQREVEGGWPASEGVLVLGVGTHEVVIRAPNGRSVSARVVVTGHEEALLDVDAVALSPPEPASPGGGATTRATETRARAPDPARASSGTDPAPWVVFGAGLGGSALGLVLVGIGVAELSTVQDARPGTEWATLAGANERAPILTGVGYSLLGVGLGVTVLGLVLALLPGADESEHATGPTLRGSDLVVRF